MQEIKTREDLFKKIAKRIVDEGLCEENDYEALINGLAICIGNELDSYTIIEGACNMLEPERKKDVTNGIFR